MKNYLKFMVAIVGITVATFGTITNANAKIAANVTCKGGGTCGWTGDCTRIDSTAS